MGAMDFQLGLADEVTYNVGVAPTRFYEYESEDIGESYGRTEGEQLRVGSAFQRGDRFTPYFSGAAGTVQLAVMTKGFGFLLKHMLGALSTSGPAETAAYTHTAVEGDLYGKSFTLQVNRPRHPSGAAQPFTYRGGKVTEWALNNSVDGNLLLDLSCDFAQVDTTTSLAAASYPAAMDNFSWAGGVLSIGGVPYDVTEIGLTGNNGLDVERRQIRRNTDKKEPTGARREGSFSIAADFDSIAQRARALSDTKAGAQASLVASWEGPALIAGASTLRPRLTVTCPSVRFDEWSAAVGGPEAVTQSLSGPIRYDGTQSPISIAYVTADTTP